MEYNKFLNVDSKTFRILALVGAAFFGLCLSYSLKQYACCIKELFAWTDDGKVIDHLNAVLIGLFVFIALWLFRTRDTREQISQARENIDQGNLFQALGDLTSKESLKIEIGVSRIIEISKGADKNIKKQIYFNFIKRLKEAPTVEGDTVLTYAQHILVWLRDYIIKNEKDKVDLNHLKFDKQEFVIEEFKSDKKNDNPFHFFLNEEDKTEKYNIHNYSFVGAHLQGVSLWKVDSLGVDLRGADLKGADLTGFNLKRIPSNLTSDIDLREAKNVVW